MSREGMSRETPTTTLWLLRHGETDWTAAHRLSGSTDVPLNETGRRQAADAGRALASLVIDTIWSSDLRRAKETASIARPEQPAEADPRLRELDFGRLEGRTWDELDEQTQRSMFAFDDYAAPGGESTATMRERVRSFVDALPAGTHLVVTHGGVIRIVQGLEGILDAPYTPAGTWVRVALGRRPKV